MKVLVACEFSGIVRDAFEDAGCDAWSCDLLSTESQQTQRANKHIQGDVLTVINSDWDLLLGFPPCTYLSYAYTGKERYSNKRLQQKIEALQFFLKLWTANINHICIENPLGYISSALLPYSQIVEPYFFGDNYKKRTCLWLKNLPKLEYVKCDNLFEKQTAVTAEYRMVSTKTKGKSLPAKFNRFSGKERSKFHSGMANAMARQWTDYLKNIS